MLSCFFRESAAGSVPVTPLRREELAPWLEGCDERLRRWVKSTGFAAEPHTVCLLPGESGALEGVLVGAPPAPLWSLASLPTALPLGDYRLESSWPAALESQAAVGWGLGAYQFGRYKRPARSSARLHLPAGADTDHVQPQVEASYLARDLINTPAEDLMPAALAGAVTELGDRYSAEVTVIEGNRLLEENYPAIHAVGRASSHPPCLIDLRWGEQSNPRVTLVGKGVCFDSGGLDLKPSKGMRLMKKDMGGAAHAIALAQLVMACRLPVRLRLLVPAVENAVAGNAYRPGDVLKTRAGLTVEIDNTDAEGRVILCDALFEADTESPEVLLDFATLTGAARVAVGTELPAMFCNDEQLAERIRQASVAACDEVWRLPLHPPYREMLDSKIADLVNSASSPYAGAITAALFLEAFVKPETSWAHFDLMAWNLASRPGRPEGGEAMGLRGIFRYLAERFAGAR